MRPLTLALILALSALAACGFNDCTGLGELTPEELEVLCEEVEDRTKECDDGITATRSSEQCRESRYREDCEATVGDWRACNEADPCDFFHPACGAAADCLAD